MASVTYGGGITNAVGSHGGTTFARNKGGNYMKKKVHGVNPRSELQLRMRTSIGQLSKYYSNTLTDPQRSAWAAFAATYPVINRLGNTTFLSAQQMFTKANAQVLAGGNPIVATPPATTAVGTPTTITIAAAHGGPGTLSITNAVAAPTGNDKVIYWCSPPLNPGRSFISSQLRRMASLYTVNATNNVLADYLAQFGLTPTGASQRIIARMAVVNTVTGITSSQLQGTTLWT